MSLRTFASGLMLAGSVACPAMLVAGQATASATKDRTTTAGNTATRFRTSWGAPDLQGVWSTATTTPLERPAELAGKEFLTPEEAAEWSKRMVTQRDTDRRREGNADVTAAYNNAWYDYGTKAVSTRRTSLIVDPSDGRVPPLTAEGQKRAAAAIPNSGFQDGRILGSWLDRGLWERCITRGLPDVMLPTAYNNNYQIVQTPDTVAILAEMIHDVRVIPLDGRPHLTPGLRQWMGNSRGHWEGDTLVVDTTGFTDKTTFRGSSENLHLTERFTRTERDLLIYRVTIDDSTTFTKPWTIEIPATPADGTLYEYACHEGNYAMVHALSGSRAKEAEEARKRGEK
jgi:hypothetical protein